MTGHIRYATLSNQQLQQIHAACELFERGLGQGEPVAIEECLASVSESVRDALFYELLAIELERQLPSDDWPQIDGYLARFPDRHHEIAGVVEEVSMAWTGMERAPIAEPKASEMLYRTSDSRYHVYEEIARGGMGIIHRGCDTDLGRELAIKVLLDTHKNKPEVIQRFIEEAQIGAQLQHPGIAPVYELGQFADERPFFSMKLITGETLAELLAKRKDPVADRGKFIVIFLQVCQTMAYAHSRQVIHRDLKPSNIMVGAFGEVQVMDWGLAKVLNQSHKVDIDKTCEDQKDARMVQTLRSKSTSETQSTFGVDGSRTQLGSVMGTPAYMPPEQARGDLENLDERADVFGLGAILCEIQTGHPPYLGTENTAVVRQASRGNLDACLTRLDSCGADPDLIAFTKHCLAPQAKDRPRDARVVADRVSEYLASVEIKLRETEMDRALQSERLQQQQQSAGKLQKLIGGLAMVAVIAVATSLVAVQSTRNANVARLNAERSEERTRQSEATTNEQRKRADDQADFAQQNLFYAEMHVAHQAWREHRGLSRMLAILANWLPEGESSDRRGWEWFYLNSLPLQNLQTLTERGLNGRPSTVAWHIASKRLAEGAADGTIRIWDYDRQKTAFTIEGPVPATTFWGINWLAWNPNGQSIAAGGFDGTIHIWETNSGHEMRVLRGPPSPIRSVAFNSSGTRIASWGEDGTIRVWDASTGELTSEVAHPAGVSAGAWSPDDELVATGHYDGTVTISSMNTGAEFETLPAHVDSIYHVAWSPDSTRLATTSSNDFFVSIWDVGTKEKVLGPLRHSHGITSIAWEPNGQRLATGSMDETIKIWDTATGKEARTFRGHVQSITGLSWGPDGSLASACNDGSVKVWDANRDQELAVWPAHRGRATAIAWSPDGQRLASGGDDGYIKIWRAATRVAERSLKAHDESQVNARLGLIGSLAWSSNGKHLASAGTDGTAKVWDVADGRLLFALPADHGMVWSVAWSPDGTRLVVGCEDGKIGVIDGVEQTPNLRFFQAHEKDVRTLTWSPQGDRLASGAWGDPFVRIWDTTNGMEHNRLEGHRGSVLNVAWSPDGKHLASASTDYSIITWEVGTERKLVTMNGHSDFVDAVAWSPDAARLASAGLDNSIRIWDPQSGKETLGLRGSHGTFHDVSWSADGTQLAAASSDGQIWIWDATLGF